MHYKGKVLSNFLQIKATESSDMASSFLFILTFLHLLHVAAALIYNSASDSGTSRTQSQVCSVANISEVTLRGLLKIFEGLLEKLGEVSKQ